MDPQDPDPNLATEPLEVWTVAQPDPRGGRYPGQGIKGLPAFTFECTGDAGEQIRRTLKIHNTGVLRSHATVWCARPGGAGPAQVEAQRPARDEPAQAEVIPAPTGDAHAVILREEVELLAGRQAALTRDVTSLELRRDALQREIDGMIERRERELGSISRTRTLLLKAEEDELERKMQHNQRVLDEANRHLMGQLANAWQLGEAVEKQRSVVTREVAAQAEDLGKIRAQLRDLLTVDRFGEVLREGREAFRDALNSPLGLALQLKVAGEMQAEIEKSGGKPVTREQVVDAMVFSAQGTRLRIEALNRLASVHGASPTAQALAFAASWITGQAGDDPKTVEDFIAARAA